MDANSNGDVVISTILAVKPGPNGTPAPHSTILLQPASGPSQSLDSGSDIVRRVYFSGPAVYGLRGSGSLTPLWGNGGFTFNMSGWDQPLLTEGTPTGQVVSIEAANGIIHTIDLNSGNTNHAQLQGAEIQKIRFRWQSAFEGPGSNANTHIQVANGQLYVVSRDASVAPFPMN